MTKRMFSRLKLRTAGVVLGSLLVGLGLAVIPTASSADQCTVTVTLLTGQTLTFSVNVPPGTPASALVPPGTGPVKNVSASCVPTNTSSGPSIGTTTSSSSTTPQSTTTPASSTGQTKSSGKTLKPHSRLKHRRGSAGQISIGPATKVTKPKTPATTSAGVPTPANPTFSFALPGPAPLGVPNFFIDSFRIPPFLLPIYQAAGIEYDVPWQILAGINEIETDYGRNLSVSTAGAVGWMQFLPSTWKRYGQDETGSGYADPYNPVDAIFAAARYLHAAGASTNLAQAIFAYNHASWYVESVLLRAKLIGGMPEALVGALTGLVEGHFPVAAPAKYADSGVTRLARTRIKASNAAVTIESNAGNTGTQIFAAQNSPVIAVNDGKIVKIGHSKRLGNYVELQDATGNTYTYANLGSISKTYPVPKPVKVTAAQIARQLSIPTAPPPQAPASAGVQPTAPTVSIAKASKEAKSQSKITLPTTSAKIAPATAGSQNGAAAKSAASAPSQTIAAPLVKERLFADPSRPASYAAGGVLQINNSGPAISSFENYFSDVLHLGKNEYTLQPLKAGAIVVAGTILGRIGKGTPTLASHLTFMIRPAGKNAPYIDPKPILDGWKLLEATAIYRAAGVNPFFGPGAKNPSVGQVLLMSKEQLQNRVLADPHVVIYACGRRDIQAGLIDRRILAVIEFLAASDLDPTVSGLECGHSLTASTGVDAAGATGSSLDISKINNIPISGHQGPGSITDITIRRLLTLQGTFRPDAIISAMSYKGQTNTIAMKDHANRIQVTYTPLFGYNKKLSQELASLLKPGQWIDLMNRLSQIPEPVVPIAPSRYAIKVTR
jgi:hypothetical protein